MAETELNAKELIANAPPAVVLMSDGINKRVVTEIAIAKYYKDMFCDGELFVLLRTGIVENITTTHAMFCVKLSGRRGICKPPDSQLGHFEPEVNRLTDSIEKLHASVRDSESFEKWLGRWIWHMESCGRIQEIH